MDKSGRTTRFQVILSFDVEIIMARILHLPCIESSQITVNYKKNRQVVNDIDLFIYASTFHYLAYVIEGEFG